MPAIITVKSEEVMSPELAQDYVDVLNGIVWFCESDIGYHEGWRNEIAVNLTVASYRLGLDPMAVLKQFEDHDLIDPGNDDEWPDERVRRCLNYTHSFNWGWGIDLSWWATAGRDNFSDIESITFMLDTPSS